MRENKLKRWAALACAMAASMFFMACSGASSGKPANQVSPISVAFSGTVPTSLQPSATQSLTAVVSNDTSSNPQVSWSVTCGSQGACGSFNPTTTASGSATTYTAPSAVPSGNTVTITATSMTDPTKSATATITISTGSSTGNLGTVSGVAAITSCPSGVGFVGGAACYTAQVDCPNTDTITATLGYAAPAGTPNGLIVAFGGTSGTTNGPDGALLDSYRTNGYSILQVTWSYPWEETNANASNATHPWNVQTAACRPATILNWARYNASGPLVTFPSNNAQAGMCAEGFSAGSAAVAYSLSWYGADKFIDKVELMAGPVLSDIGQGCVVPNPAQVNVCGGATPAYCQGWPSGGVAGTLSFINGTENDVAAWTGDSSCNNSSHTATTPTSFNAWEAESILSGANGAKPNLSYPNTSVTAWLCASSTDGVMNNSSPQGWDYYQAIGGSGTQPLNFLVNAVDNCNGPEGILTGTPPTGTIPGGPYGGLDATTAISNDMSMPSATKTSACTKSPGH